MAAAAIPAFRLCDLAFHVAAVADFRPASRLRGKLKKRRALAAGGGRVRLALVANPDILWSCGRIKHERQILVGFALEAANGERNAREKLREKNLDFVVWNDPSALNADRSNVTVIGRDGERVALRGRKSGIGRRLVALAIQRWQRRSHETTQPHRKWAPRKPPDRRHSPAARRSRARVPRPRRA
jgi:phosphopantothenoylcysteine decarboxylase/phosphopantothenate--cysteine ligase